MHNPSAPSPPRPSCDTSESTPETVMESIVAGIANMGLTPRAVFHRGVVTLEGVRPSTTVESENHDHEGHSKPEDPAGEHTANTTNNDTVNNTANNTANKTTTNDTGASARKTWPEPEPSVSPGVEDYPVGYSPSPHEWGARKVTCMSSHPHQVLAVQLVIFR
jgi:hypothetical protein